MTTHMYWEDSTYSWTHGKDLWQLKDTEKEPQGRKTYKVMSGESGPRLPLFCFPGPHWSCSFLQQGHACQHSRLSEGEHMLSVNHSICTNMPGRLVQQNPMPQVDKVALLVSNLGTLREAKFSDTLPGQLPKQALLIWGSCGNSFLHRSAVRTNDSSW